jgi:glucuronoarabinoxylan endo-1,4-beta-xylanase
MFNRLIGRLSRPSRHRRAARVALRVEPLESRLVPSTIDWNQTYQTIDGFGASSAWIVPSLTSDQANLLFSPTLGIGLSLLRSRIRPDTSAWSDEVSTMQTAQSMGVTVWSTPWSPPAAWKDNNSVDNGGHLLPDHYQDYADLLAQYVLNMQGQGITIHAVSIANEPNFTASYESSRWTAAEFAAFLPVLKNTFDSDGITAQILLPEETSWNFELADNIFSDPSLAADVGIVAGHNYGGTPAPVPQAAGKGLWETEVSSFETFDPGIGNALGWARNIHDFMTVAHAGAWHYWWIKSSGNDNEGLLGPNWELTKRLWAVGNYSRFVRPGWVDIGATDDGGVLVSAFKDPVSGQFAIVAVNQGSAVSRTFNLHGFVTGAVTPWVTSAGLDLAQQADIAVGGGSFTADLPAQSVTTFVGAAAFESAADLSAAFNATGIYDDGSTFDANGGLDGQGDAFSSSLLGGSVNWNGADFNLGASGVNDVVQAAGQTIALPQGQYATLAFLATAVNGSQANQTFTVTYTDGTTQTFTQGISDWGAGPTFDGESVAVSTSYLDRYDGSQESGPWDLYGYQVALDPTKTVSSITLPNNSNVNVFAMTLLVPVGAVPAVRSAGREIDRPQGQSVSLHFLAVNGDQLNRTFSVTNADETLSSSVNAKTAWMPVPEPVLVRPGYLDRFDGRTRVGHWEESVWPAASDPMKTVDSALLGDNDDLNADRRPWWVG